MSIRVTVWNEFIHEREMEEARRNYPEGIHGAIAGFLSGEPDLEVTTAVLGDPEQGLPDALLDVTDVLIWWGHIAHRQVDDALVEKIVARVYDGMGMVFLHSAHHSKPFRRLCGTGCDLKWWVDGDRERLFTLLPGHPIAAGLPEYFELPAEETYCELFDIPTPDEVVFSGWFSGGAVFRSGCCFHYGRGRYFYFQPGHETYPTYHDENVRRVIKNAVRWAAPAAGPKPTFGHFEPFEAR